MEDVFVSLVVLVIIARVYLLPSLIAADRGVPNVGSVVVINILLGWTLVGWAVALAMAVRSRPNESPTVSAVSVDSQPPPVEVPASSGDTVVRLKDLAELHERGALTDEEFALAKARCWAESSRALPPSAEESRTSAFGDDLPDPLAAQAGRPGDSGLRWRGCLLGARARALDGERREAASPLTRFAVQFFRYGMVAAKGLPPKPSQG